MSLQIGMVGLGRMGANMARRLAGGGAEVVGFDSDPNARTALAGSAGCSTVDDMEALIHALPAPRIVWLMVPAGEPTEETLAALAPRLLAEDVIVDGGNAFYKDSVRRAVASARSTGVASMISPLLDLAWSWSCSRSHNTTRLSSKSLPQLPTIADVTAVPSPAGAMGPLVPAAAHRRRRRSHSRPAP